MRPIAIACITTEFGICAGELAFRPHAPMAMFVAGMAFGIGIVALTIEFVIFYRKKI